MGETSSISTVEVQNIHSTINKEAQQQPQKRYTSINRSKAPAKPEQAMCCMDIRYHHRPAASIRGDTHTSTHTNTQSIQKWTNECTCT